MPGTQPGTPRPPVASGSESDPLARLFEYAVKRVKHMPVGREWWLAARGMGEALIEFGKIAALGVRISLAIIRAVAGLGRGRGR